MNVLFLVPRSVYETKMARERFRWMAAVNAHVYPHGVHVTGPGWPDWKEGASPVDNIKWYLLDRKHDREVHPHLVVTYMVDDLQGSPIPTVVILQEAYNRPKTWRTIRATDAKLVVFTYANEVPQYEADLAAEGRQVVVIPHSGDETLFKDYGEPKDIDILIVGNMNQAIYPFRRRLAALAWRELRKRAYRVVRLPHPGYALPVKPGCAVGEDYARLLNRSRLVITCTSRYKYALTKLVEIPLARALPVSDIPEERQAFFKQTVLHVEPWMLDREIRTAMEDCLDDEDAWAQRVKVAHDKVEVRLTMKFWAERFVYWGRRFLGEVDMAPPMPPVGDEDT
jgi:hypothetical protein